MANTHIDVGVSLTPEQVRRLREAYAYDDRDARAQHEALSAEMRWLYEMLYSPWGNSFASEEDRERIRERIEQCRRERREIFERMVRGPGDGVVVRPARPHYATWAETPTFEWRHLGQDVEPLTERQIEEQRRRQEEEHQALERSKQLLLSCLTQEQQRQLENENCFYVTGQSGTLYKVYAHMCYNVVTPQWQFCAGPQDVPIYDYMLAQKLMLETDEDAFLATANKHPKLSVGPEHYRQEVVVGLEQAEARRRRMEAEVFPFVQHDADGGLCLVDIAPLPRPRPALEPTDCELNDTTHNPGWWAAAFALGGQVSVFLASIAGIASHFTRFPKDVSSALLIAGTSALLTGGLLMLVTHYARKETNEH